MHAGAAAHKFGRGHVRDAVSGALPIFYVKFVLGPISVHRLHNIVEACLGRHGSQGLRKSYGAGWVETRKPAAGLLSPAPSSPVESLAVHRFRFEFPRAPRARARRLWAGMPPACTRSRCSQKSLRRSPAAPTGAATL